MLLGEVKVGHFYAVKVNGIVRPVRVDSVNTGHGRYLGQGRYAEATHWFGTNMVTGNTVRIRSAAKMRYECEWDGRLDDFPPKRIAVVR